MGFLRRRFFPFNALGMPSVCPHLTTVCLYNISVSHNKTELEQSQLGYWCVPGRNKGALPVGCKVASGDVGGNTVTEGMCTCTGNLCNDAPTRGISAMLAISCIMMALFKVAT